MLSLTDCPTWGKGHSRAAARRCSPGAEPPTGECQPDTRHKCNPVRPTARCSRLTRTGTLARPTHAAPPAAVGACRCAWLLSRPTQSKSCAPLGASSSFQPSRPHRALGHPSHPHLQHGLQQTTAPLRFPQAPRDTPENPSHWTRAARSPTYRGSIGSGGLCPQSMGPAATSRPSVRPGLTPPSLKRGRRRLLACLSPSLPPQPQGHHAGSCLVPSWDCRPGMWLVGSRRLVTTCAHVAECTLRCSHGGLQGLPHPWGPSCRDLRHS